MKFKLEKDDDSFWMSIGDLMSGLLMLFVLITLFALYKIHDSGKVQADIFSELEKVSKQNKFNLKINEKNGTIEIADEILFERNKSELKHEGKLFLDRFIPKLSEVVFKNSESSNEIISIDIEGHTSELSTNPIFQKTMMILSLARSQSVWVYIHEKFRSQQNSKKLINKLKVCGWGNTKASKYYDIQSDRKVVFQMHFRGLLEKLRGSE